jgi:hypothetical protein
MPADPGTGKSSSNMTAYRTAARASALGLIAMMLFGGTVPAWAGEADVIQAKVEKGRNGTYNFDVTIRSNDRGWDYYCDRFEVLGPAGKVFGVRTLYHPHETEQPFTRELYGVKIPAGITEVHIRARHKPRGYDGKTLPVMLP